MADRYQQKNSFSHNIDRLLMDLVHFNNQCLLKESRNNYHPHRSD